MQKEFSEILKVTFQVAVKHYYQSLEVYVQERDQARWSEVQENLALAYKELEVDTAIPLKTLILQLPAWKNPYKSIRVKKTLKIGFQPKLIVEIFIDHVFLIQNSDCDLVNAEKSYQQVIDTISRDERPENWARARGGLGETYLAKKDLTNAISNYKMALEVFSPNNFPKKSFQTSDQLGNLYYFQKDFRSAREFYTIAHEAIELMRNEIQRESSKRELAGKNVEVYERLVYCCLLEGDVLAALEYVFAAKSRVFLDQLVSTRLDLSTTAANNSAFASDIKKEYIRCVIKSTDCLTY